MSDEQFFEKLNGEYQNFSELEMKARRVAVEYLDEFPAHFRMRPFIEEAIRKGLVQQTGEEYRLRVQVGTN